MYIGAFYTWKRAQRDGVVKYMKRARASTEILKMQNTTPRVQHCSATCYFLRTRCSDALGHKVPAGQLDFNYKTITETRFATKFDVSKMYIVQVYYTRIIINST